MSDPISTLVPKSLHEARDTIIKQAREIERLEGWLERISREDDMQVSVIMPAIEEWQEDKTNG